MLARLHRVSLNIVDVGVDGDLDAHPGLLARKVRHGSRNMLHEAAMIAEELTLALEIGLLLARQAAGRGESILAVGEMRIGNTTAASALTAEFLFPTKPHAVQAIRLAFQQWTRF